MFDDPIDKAYIVAGELEAMIAGTILLLEQVTSSVRQGEPAYRNAALAANIMCQAEEKAQNLQNIIADSGTAAKTPADAVTA